MCLKKVTLSVFVLFALISIFAAKEVKADYYHQTFIFEKGDLKFEKLSELSKQTDYDLVIYNELEMSQEIGKPQLPVEIVQLALPEGKEIAEITVKSIESEYLAGDYFIAPAQPPKILSKSDEPTEFVQPDKDTYSSNTPYPEKVVEIAKQGFIAGYNIGSILVYPVQYIPIEKKLIFHSKIVIEISYKDCKSSPRPYSKRTDYARNVLENSIKNMVKNPQDIQLSLTKASPTKSDLPDEEHVYVIITTDEMQASFQPLADWKKKKGLSATIVTTSWIYEEYSGVDQAEQVRNFIIDAYQNWGTLYVLLGGDTYDYQAEEWIVPFRYAYAMTSGGGAGSWEDMIPCDLYFADLDGTWDDNGNYIFGEVDDNIDMYPDIFVGRATAETDSEAVAFVNKILTYETNPPVDYQLDMLFLAMMIDYNTNSAIAKDYIDSMYVPERFDPITKLYEANGNENYETVMTALNEGQNIINHDGHAHFTVMSIGDGVLFCEDMDALTNAPRFPILFSIGCIPAGFDYDDCIGEHFVKNPNGGGVAFVGNSRYGWYSPGNPIFGISDRFDQQFYNHLFTHNIYNIGNTMNSAKTVYIPFAGTENVYRWCIYEITLLGEPEMPIWTDTPSQLVVDFPETLPPGESLCDIIVSDGMNPVEGAMVCLMKQDEVYQTKITGPGGYAQFSVSPSTPTDGIQLTVTAQNFIPFEDTISITTNEPYVQISQAITPSSIYYDSCCVAPGDSTFIGIAMHNYGNETANNVSVLLSCDNPNITLIDSIHNIGDIEPGETDSLNAFHFNVGSDITNGEIVNFVFEISADPDYVWDDIIVFRGATPMLSYSYHSIVDTAFGNGNGIPEPGETVTLNLILENDGLRSSGNVIASLSSDDPYISFPQPNWQFENIEFGGFGMAGGTVVIDVSCPTPYFPQINLDIQTEPLLPLGTVYQFTDSLILNIGSIGFADDMEQGETNWTHCGDNDAWHLTSYRNYSGDFSWYCGIEGQFVYNDSGQDTLQSVPIILGNNSELSFWLWYEFPNYGSDGVYVEINDGSEWITLDFIGNGGDLPTLNIQSDWLEYNYDLSQYPSGTEIDLRFRFVGDEDGDIAEGIYIDDIKVQEKQEIVTANFSANVTYGAMPLTVQFTDESISEFGSVVQWHWDFGDGETSTEQNPEHTYQFQGKKTVTLTVTDELGFTDTKTRWNYIDVATGGGYVIYVTPDSGNYPTIKAGIEAVYDGDTLLLADGIYTGYDNKNVSVEGKDITITSENGNDNCIIDCEGIGCAFILGNNDSLTVIKGIKIINGYKSDNGGAINAVYNSARIEDCIFENCITEQCGGAIIGDYSSDLIIRNCEFINNSTVTKGGAIYCIAIDNFIIEDCIFENCSAGFGSGVSVESDSIAVIKSCTFSYGTVDNDGGAIYSKNNYSLSIIDCEISNHTGRNAGAIYSNADSSLVLEKVVITDNQVSNYGGAIYLLESNANITNCIIQSNSATQWGGAVYCNVSNPVLVNCLITDNSTTGTTALGGAFYCENADLMNITNCTISNNSAQMLGGGMFLLNTIPNIANSIFWNDSPSEFYSDLDTISITYSDIQDGWTGEGNIDEDPMFVNPDSMDYHLHSSSPCIDTGNSDTTGLYLPISDLDRNQRIWDGDGDEIAIIDMGCYEYDAPSVPVDKEIVVRPLTYKLYQNYPNPFNPETTIRFSIPEDRNVELSVYNIKGQKVCTLVDNKLEKGIHSVIWKGKNNTGKQVSSGIYLYKLKAGNSIAVKKMLLLR